MSRRGWLLIAAAAALLIAVFFGTRQLLQADRSGGVVAARAPSFEAVTATFPPVTRTLEDYAGNVVLLNIWATWCGPCRYEMPSLQALHEEFGDRGLKIVAVSIDHPAAGDAIREFAESYGLTFEILHDTTGAIRATYRTSGIPETALIGRDGTIRRRVAGAEMWNSDSNRALVARLLEEEPPRQRRGG